MSLFLAKLSKYWEDQKPIDILTYENKKYKDPIFTADNMIFSQNEEKNKQFLKSLNLSNKNDLLDNIGFLRITQIYEIFDKDINCSLFQQSNFIGDCYFLDTLSVLSNYAQLLTQIFRIDKRNEIGYYEICLFINGQWQIVIVDDLIPIYKSNNTKKYFTSFPAKNCKCCYFILLEKAWAKVNGSYVDIECGLSTQAFEAITGFTSCFLLHKNENIIFSIIYEGLREYGYFFCGSSNPELLADDNKSTEEEKVGHAFSVICADIQKFSEYKDIKVLQLRNPWGFNIKERAMITDSENSLLFQKKLGKFLLDEDKGLFWIDIQNYFKYFNKTEICFSMLGSTVHTMRFTNLNKDWDHNVFLQREGKLIFKFQLEADARVILSSFFNIFERKKEGQTNSEINFIIVNILNGDKTIIKSPELTLKRGKYLIIGEFKGVDLIKDVSLIVQIYSQENLFFEFIKNIKSNETINDYQILFDSEKYQTLKRVKYIYKHCEDLREKFLYHKTLIKFLKEKLGCEFTLSGLGFYIDSFQNNKVDCIIRIDKTKTAKFKQIVVSQKIEKSNKPSNIYVGVSHINGEVIGRGEVWELKENCQDDNYEKPLDTKLIFRGKITKNNQIKDSEKIEDNTTSEFKETYNYDESNENEGNDYQNKERIISNVEFYEKEDDEISVHSELETINNINWRIKSPLHSYLNHNLFLCETERFFGDGYLCNRCKTAFKNTVPSYYCTRCDFDIC